MRTLIGLLAGISLLLCTCSETIEAPQSMRLDLTVTVMDTTGFSEEISGSQMIDSVAVFVNSISFQLFFEALSNTGGLALFPEILPDVYNISATRRIVQIQDGVRLEKVMNGQLQNVEVYGEAAFVTIYMEPTVLGQLLISEIYYNGSPADPIPYYFHDQFTEIYNNSDSTLYLDSLIIADAAHGSYEDDFTHSVHAYMFPGSGKDYPLAPGEFVIVAQDATNHAEYNKSSLDLSGADFEYYVKSTGDVDNPEVTNMIQLHHKYGVDFLYSVMSDAIVLVKVKDPYAYGYDTFNEILLPKSAILDGVDYRDNLTEVEYKRLDPSIDAGMTGGIDMYKGKSVERRIDFYKGSRPILMDNNNSSIDFQVLNTPTPGWISGTEE